MCISGPGLPTRHLVKLPPASFTLGFRYLTLKLIVCWCMGIFSPIQYISEDKKKYTVISRELLYFLIFIVSVCVMIETVRTLPFISCIYTIYTPFIFSLSRSFMNYVNIVHCPLSVS